MRSTRLLAAAVAAAAVAVPLIAAPATADTGGLPALPHGIKPTKTLVIGLAGTLLSRIQDADAPHLDALMRNGMTARSSLYSGPFAPTLSGPGWSTIATGVWPDKHGVKDNTFAGKRFDQYPDFLTRLEQADPRISTLAISSWSPLASSESNGDVFGPRTDVRIATGDNEDETNADAVHYLKDGDPDAAFVHIDEVDEAGHAYGAASQEYLDAIHDADTRVGKMVAAIEARPTYAKEKWNILVTADHGHTPAGGHGGNSWDERQTFLIADGPGFAPGSVRHNVRMADIAPTVLRNEGVEPKKEWGLDGTPVNRIEPDAFDTLRGKLQGPKDETGIPAGTLGWTHEAPAGWSIDNARMPAGGVAEWSGWSFATDDLWSRTEAGQGRENNVHARDVFAVADSDEWADKPHSGTFDSTLVGPAWKVAGRKTATLSFATEYRQDGAQRGEVSVSWDGGAPQPVKTYDADANGMQSLKVAVPSGAHTAQFRFRYTGDNNWYWTLDQVRLTTS